MNEIARFQRFSRVRTRGARSSTGLAARSTPSRPLESSAERPARADRAGRRSRRPGTRPRPRHVRQGGVTRTRRPGCERRRSISSPGVAAMSSSRRSSSFWSTSRTRKSRCVWARATSSRRSELVDAVDRRDDKIESHGRTLTPVPLVSVLLAVHNDARFLGAAVAERARSDRSTDLELIVVDDASTDETPAYSPAARRPAASKVLRNDEQLGLARVAEPRSRPSARTLRRAARRRRRRSPAAA